MRGGGDLSNHKQCSIAHSLSLLPFLHSDMTENTVGMDIKLQVIHHHESDRLLRVNFRQFLLFLIENMLLVLIGIHLTSCSSQETQNMFSCRNKENYS